MTDQDKKNNESVAAELGAEKKQASGPQTSVVKGKGLKHRGGDKPESPFAVLGTFGSAIALALVIRMALFEFFEIEGPSMEPSLLNGDRVVVSKFSYGLSLYLMKHALFSWSMPNAGDIIILQSPADEVAIVKRVIGVPGDRVEMRNDQVYVNGAPIHTRVLGACAHTETSEEPTDCESVEEGIGERRWRISHSTFSAPDSMEEQTVPPGHVFVLGDHRDRSNDSRNPMVGMIPVSRVRGRAQAVYWSRETGGSPRWSRFFSAVR